MPSYLFVYRSEVFDPSKVSPEDMQQSMDRWGKWIGQGMQEGWLVDPGDALLPHGKVVATTKAVTDGPFMEAKECVGGYSIVKAASFDEAAKYAKTNPNLVEGGSVEIRQLAGLAPK